MSEPKTYFAATVSSAFRDLEQYRAELIDALHFSEILPRVMEYDTARADPDVIDASLQFVRDTHAYICVIGARYGQTPYCPTRNPERRSISELEFDEAIRLGKPILLFVAAADHKWAAIDIEFDYDNRVKLDTFRSHAQNLMLDDKVFGALLEFTSLPDFSRKARREICRLSDHLRETASLGNTDRITDAAHTMASQGPQPPEFRALPRYVAPSTFVGREEELKAIDTWAHQNSRNPVLVLEAEFGMGKSSLTWEWVTERAAQANPGLRGRFWYSFYPSNATIPGFCREALAYINRGAQEDYAHLDARTLKNLLLDALGESPWLLILDGLERLLVRYNSPNAVGRKDELVAGVGEVLADRDPRAAITPDDDIFLRRLAAASPSRILVSSRLMPSALVALSGDPIAGVQRAVLNGLSPIEAASMLIADGIVTKDRPAMERWLDDNCGGHPLKVRRVARSVVGYSLAPGDFDAWVRNPADDYLTEAQAVEESDIGPPSPIDIPTGAPEFEVKESGFVRRIEQPIARREDPDQLLLHGDCQGKAARLQEEALKVSNQFPYLSEAARRYRTIIESDASEIDARIVWSAANRLRGLLESHRGAVKDDRFGEQLPPNPAEALRDLVETHAIWFLGHPDARTIEEHLRTFFDDPILDEDFDAAANVAAAAADAPHVFDPAVVASAQDDLAAARLDSRSAAMARRNLQNWAYSLMSTVCRFAWRSARWGGGTVLSYDLVRWLIGQETVLAPFVRQVMADGPIWWNKLMSMLSGIG